MKNFKPGQRVVFIHDGSKDDPRCILPKEGEIITIVRIDKLAIKMGFPGHWLIKEYPNNKTGGTQSIHESCLFPIEEKGISLTMHNTSLSELKPKEVLEKTINDNLMQWQ